MLSRLPNHGYARDEEDLLVVSRKSDMAFLLSSSEKKFFENEFQHSKMLSEILEYVLKFLFVQHK